MVIKHGLTKLQMPSQLYPHKAYLQQAAVFGQQANLQTVFTPPEVETSIKAALAERVALVFVVDLGLILMAAAAAGLAHLGRGVTGEIIMAL
jgi:hypothetical protein